MAQLEKVPQASVILINVLGKERLVLDRFVLKSSVRVATERSYDLERAESDQWDGVKPRSIFRDWCDCSLAQSAVCLLVYGSLFWLKFYTALK